MRRSHRSLRDTLVSLAATVLALGASPALAQDALAGPAGLYDGSQVEVAAGLFLGEDGRFDYLLSYGALDERATGAWTVEDGNVVLDSDPVTAPAFELIDQAGGSAGIFEITLDVPEALPVELFAAALLLSDGTGMPIDFEGQRLSLELQRGQAVAALWLAFPLYSVASERIEVPPGTGAMRFAFRPNDLGKVAFRHEVLRQEDGALVLARHDRVLRFRKVDDEAADYPGPEGY